MAKIGMSQKERDSNMKAMAIYLGVVLGLISIYSFCYIFSLQESERVGLFDSFKIFMGSISEGKFGFEINAQAAYGIPSGAFVGLLVFFFIDNDNKRRRHYDNDTVAGSGGFMDKKEMKEYAEKYIAKDPPAIKEPTAYNPEKDKDMYSKNMIMSNKFCRPINSRALIGNNNVLIVGGAGTGKSRFYIKPNLLQLNASYVITDPSGEMIFSVGKVLKDHGYKIKIFNISDMGHSNCYNPLEYIRDEAGVNMLIQCFITNTTQGEGGGDNQFFVDAEKLLYSACIFYLRDFCTDRTKNNFASVMDMINASSVNEMDPNASSPLDLLFDKLPHSSLAWKYYKAFKQAAGKTLKSIIISCVTRLQPFMTPQVVNLTKRDELELGMLGNEKTALFIITPQADRTYSFLASMLYSQLFETLYYIGEQQKAAGQSEQLHIPVRCMMDEFANIGEVPEFPSKLATMRKYNISASIVLQDTSQIEAMYKDTWKTLVGNCSTMVFLGTQEPNTLKYFSEMLGNMTVQQESRQIKTGKQGSGNNIGPTKREVMTADELGRMPSDECIVFTQNRRPVRDKKYKYENHPYYSQTADADNSNGFLYNTMSIYRNNSSTGVEYIMRAYTEANDYKAKQTAKSRMEKSKIDTANDILSGDEKAEENACKAAIQEGVFEVTNNYDNPVAVIRTNPIPTKYLLKIASSVSSITKKYPFIVFCKATLPGKEKYMVGVGVGQDDAEMEYIMKTEYTPEVMHRGRYFLTTIEATDYDGFIAASAGKYEQYHKNQE